MTNATFPFQGANVYLDAADADDLIVQLAKFGIALDKPAAGKSKAEKPAAPAASAAPAPTPAASPSPVAAAPATAKGVDYPTLQKAVFELAGLADKKGLDKSVVLDIAKAHGGDNFKGLKPEVYAAALADVQAKIKEVSAAEESVA